MFSCKKNPPIAGKKYDENDYSTKFTLECIHVKKSLKTCGFLDFAFLRSAKTHRKEGQAPTRENQNDRWNTTAVPYVANSGEFSSNMTSSDKNWFIPGTKLPNTS